jgi:hypothetical protein
LLALSGLAQSKKRHFRQSELGFFGGASYYIGDINPRNHFRDSHPAYGVFFRIAPNYRFAFRLGLSAGTISGNDAQSGEPDQLERNLNFQSKIYDLHAITEFNFVEYRIGHDRYKFSLFIFAGLAGFYFNPVSNSGTQLRYASSEGQATAYPKYQVSIPFGIGLKWNMGDKVGMGVEWGPRRTFTDYLDDIRSVYPDNGADIDPTTGNSRLAGNMRGNPSTKDWYFYYGVTLNIKLREAHRPCHKGF